MPNKVETGGAGEHEKGIRNNIPISFSIPVRVVEGRKQPDTATGGVASRDADNSGGVKTGIPEAHRKGFETRPPVGRASARHQPTWLRRVRNIVIAATLLALVLVAAGFVYTYLNSRVTPKDTKSEPTTGNYSPLVKPPKISPSTPESAAVIVINSPIKPGGQASLSVQTLPGSKCKVSISYKSKGVTDGAPEPGIADDFGTVSWNWRISGSAPPGERGVSVLCSYHKKSAVVDTSFTVEP